MSTEEGQWDSAIRYISNPRILLQGVVEYGSAWMFTRPWLSAMLICLPALILLSAMVVLVGLGAMVSPQTLVQRYSKWIGQEIPESLSYFSVDSDDEAEQDAGDNSSNDAESASSTSGEDSGSAGGSTETPDEEVSTYAELLLRRLLQLRDSDSRATYLVAAQLSTNGRRGQARQMMRRIAPENTGGFAPAHAWLAYDRLSRNQEKVEAEELDTLRHDLEEASQWAGTGPQLLSAYADLLERQGDVGGALSMLERATDRYPSLRMKLASIAARHNRTKQLERVSDTAKQQIRTRMEQSAETREDMIQLSSLFLLDGNAESALKTIRLGLKKAPGDPQLLRLQSESYRLKYTQTATTVDGKSSVNLGLLNAALTSDPTNPAVGAEIAHLLATGKDAPPGLQEALEKQLASGQAIGLTHILLAHRDLVDNKLTEAIVHLRLALRQAPNNPLVMNNLALALARTNADSLDEAIKLSQAAISAVQDASLRAEYLDTLGEIRAIAGDKIGAIEAYEMSIGLDAERRDTRQRLISTYREMGLDSMAEAQEQLLDGQPSAAN